jgi:hypothetical protein
MHRKEKNVPIRFNILDKTYTVEDLALPFGQEHSAVNDYAVSLVVSIQRTYIFAVNEANWSTVSKIHMFLRILFRIMDLNLFYLLE